MKLWATLYGMVWLVFLQLLITMDPRPPSWFIYIHAPLGLAIILLAYANYRQARATEAPARIKRTVRATLALSILMAFLGVLLWANLGTSWSILLGYSFWDLVHIFHGVNALAIIAQAAAAASAYDMWEEKEFEQRTAIGEIPPPPRPTPSR
ncbi:MAG TPA: hypothetical protein VEH57_04450 [Thermoplasmata archaeon]|nr:hypothetical protein [Thermoplasmata archaeon]